MSGRVELLRLLADGAMHSGEELAAALSVSRAAVWKRLQQLESWGIACEARPGSGYRLEAPIDLLDAPRIRERLPQATLDMLRNFEVHESLESTSDRLLAIDDLPAGRFDACLAEFQSAGRGRRGRHWVAPFASGLCLSINWSFRDAPAMLGALSLAGGVAALRALGRLGFRSLSLKWPNDILCGDAKLGGILIDLRGEAAGPAYVVVGIGINVRLPRAAREHLAADGADAVDLAAIGRAPVRNELAVVLIAELAQALVEFGARGLAAFAEEWQAADALSGRPVRVLHGGQPLEGFARGVDGDGALLLEVDGARRRILTGEVSVRPVR
jgi:BirA family transcriptional regulator, biotin operon repressor / biotin---[acetyl-CoA-carboxylase] ligase